mgnify:FL=1
MEAGHGGKSGRDASIKEIAFDYSFILKICNLLSTWKKKINNQIDIIDRLMGSSKVLA